ncbi:MAG: hypothetical protein JSV79_12445 [Armatimonadota bacterium]|nr:MAG: hypothetical protein JSV79_12445 [Armatimonadota bacterium]
MLKVRARVVLLVAAIALIGAQAAPGAVPGWVRAKLREAQAAVSVSRACEPGAEVSLVLPKGQAARLDCSHLGCGATEMLVWPTERAMDLYCVWDDGRVSKNSRPWAEAGTVWIPRPVIVLRLNWEAREDAVTLRVVAETAEDKIREAQEEHLRRREERRRNANVITIDERLLGFVRLWSAIKYNFAFFDQVPGLDWDGVLEEYLPRVREEQTTEQYYLVLQECTARLRDGHTSVICPTALRDVDMPPLLVRPVEGKAVVVGVGKAEEVLRAGLEAGLEITHVDGRSVGEVLDESMYPYISASTQQGRDRAAYCRLLEGPQGSKVTIRLRGLDGSMREVSLVRESDLSAMPWLPSRRPVVEYRDLSDGIAYVALNSFESEDVVSEFDAVFDKLRQARGMVIDVRENAGGSTGNAARIIGRLTDKPLPLSAWRTRDHLPAFRAWGMTEAWYQAAHDFVRPRGERPFLGPVVVLTGAGTVSAAEDFLIPLHASGRATLVGERTAGTTGQPLYIELPKGLRARICTKWDTYPDGREFVGVGVIPDVEVHPTQEDIAAGRDAVLEKGHEVLRARLQD